MPRRYRTWKKSTWAVIGVFVLWLLLITNGFRRGRIDETIHLEDQRRHFAQIDSAIAAHDSLPAHGNVEVVLEHLLREQRKMQRQVDSLSGRGDFK